MIEDNCKNINISGRPSNFKIYSKCENLLIAPASSGTYIKNFIVHSNVAGTTSSLKQIAIDPNTTYETNVYPVGSTDIFA